MTVVTSIAIKVVASTAINASSERANRTILFDIRSSTGPDGITL